MKKKTKNKSEVLRKRCVKLAKEISKIEAGYKCAYCGRGKPDVAVHSHHIYNEGRYRAMSADVDNLICVCYYHHNPQWNTKEPSFHRTPREMNDWLDEKYPERMKALKERTKQSILADEVYWSKKLIELKEKIKKYKNNKWFH